MAAVVFFSTTTYREQVTQHTVMCTLCSTLSGLSKENLTSEIVKLF